MGEVPRKVIRAELVLRIDPFFLKVAGPLFQCLPIQACEVRITFHLSDGSHENQEVAAFLDRHLIIDSALAIAINLAVGLGIGAEIVRGERELPALTCRVVHERNQKGLGEGWTE